MLCVSLLVKDLSSIPICCSFLWVNNVKHLLLRIYADQLSMPHLPLPT